VIPVCEPVLTESEISLALDCLRSGWISSAGKYLDEFEELWAAECGMKYGIAVCNGSAALEAALAALRLPRGSEVIIPTFTIISCATAVMNNGLVPVLVDSNPRTWGIDVDKVAERITSRTAAIMMVHIYGHPVDADPLISLADRHGLAVIEDAAEAHGANYLSDRGGASPRWRRCGGLGTISTFSFYANKLVTTGEGGMVLTNDGALAERCRSLRNLCFQRERRFYHENLGFNWRLTNIQAALAIPQIRRLEAIVARKRWIAELYNRHLQKFPGLHLPVEEPWARSVYWVYGVTLQEGLALDASEVILQLRTVGTETRPFFLGMHEQPALLKEGLFRDGAKYPIAEGLARRGFYLPSGLNLEEREIARVAEQIKSIISVR
jgi:perosamine synthetase